MKYVAVITVCFVGSFFVDSLVPLDGDAAYGYLGGFVIATIAGLVYDVFGERS